MRPLSMSVLVEEEEEEEEDKCVLKLPDGTIHTQVRVWFTKIYFENLF